MGGGGPGAGRQAPGTDGAASGAQPAGAADGAASAPTAKRSRHAAPAPGALRPAPLRLGHISYSNCVPVHHAVLEDTPADLEIVEGEPALLNMLLGAGEIDVAPCSSIEYARNADRYSILPDLSIACDGAVQSILLLSDRPPRQLSGATVALPSASATSVVLLRILLHHHWRVECEWVHFDQLTGDPFAEGADAALFIGDAALARRARAGARIPTDLGAEWRAFTGLPFVYALWQTTSTDRGAITRLHRRLTRSRDAAFADLQTLARVHAPRYAQSPAALIDYWKTLRYDLRDDLLAGLEQFYALAAEMGEVGEVERLRFADIDA